MIILFVALAVFAPNFMTQRNLLTVLLAVSFNGIIAGGMTFVIIQGDIDVSVGAAVAWRSRSPGVSAIKEGWPLGLAVVEVLAQQVLLMARPGRIGGRWAVPAFVVTLTCSQLARRACLITMPTQSRPSPIC